MLPKNEIQITNEYVDEYPSQKMLEKNTEVRVRVPISKTKNSLTGKLPKIDQNIFGNFTYKGLTKDNQYHKYQYKPSKECTPQSIKEDFLDKNKEYYQSLGITLQAQNIQIVKGNTDPYDDKQTLSVNQDVRIRINPKMIEPPITKDNDRYWMVTTSEDKVNDTNKKDFKKSDKRDQRPHCFSGLEAVLPVRLQQHDHR